MIALKLKINPYAAVFCGVLAVSFSSLFVKLSEAHPNVIAFYRLFLTFLMLLPVHFREKIKEVQGCAKKEVGLAALSGIFLALHFLLWFSSLKYTSVASSVVLVTTQPIWVVVASYIFFGEKVGKKALVGGGIALIGSTLIGAGDFQVGGTALLGDILALLGAIAISGYLIIGRLLRSRLSLPLYTTVTYGTSSLLLGLVTLLTNQPFYPYPAREWMLFFALAFVCTILGHTVFNWALKYVPASVVAVGVLGEPVGAIVWAWIFLGEIASGRQFMSALIILFGLYLFTSASRNKGKNDINK